MRTSPSSRNPGNRAGGGAARASGRDGGAQRGLSQSNRLADREDELFYTAHFSDSFRNNVAFRAPLFPLSQFRYSIVTISVRGRAVFTA